MAIIRGVIKQCMHFVLSNLDSRMSKAYPPPKKIIKTHKNKQANQTKLINKLGSLGCLKNHCRSVWEISFKIYVLFDNVNFYYFFFTIKIHCTH